jgi:Xaa-Pro aminopeptidase
MKRDKERVQRLQSALQEANVDALVCALPKHVVMMSGYWPVIGVSLGIATREGRVVVLAPEDEQELAELGWADEVQTFQAASLKELRPTWQIVCEVLAKAAHTLGLGRGSVIGYEQDEASVPAPYSAVHLFGAAKPALLQEAMPEAKFSGASEMLKRLESVLTPAEIERVRAACRVAGAAFEEGAKAIRVGLPEPEIANAFQAGLSTHAKHLSERGRVGGWVWCMSGPNAAKASAAYARTRARRTEAGDLVLVHSNSYADGYWTDITRTFCLGEPDKRAHAMYDAVLRAAHAALEVIRPGARAAEVDRVVRDLLEVRGFGKEFKHATGHGVGFSAINPNARPRLHPVSPDVLETGMVFNVEPAVYIDGYGGLRHCSMVAITNQGAEVLTPFQEGAEALVKA